MITVEIDGITLLLETDPTLFSPHGADRGTLAMLRRARIRPEDRVLDLGCGCGLVGIYAAKLCGAENVVMTDISPKAAELARKNALANGVSVETVCGDALAAVSRAGFTLILSNPPYHADFSVPKRFIEKSFNRLAVGGRLVMVTKRREWYENKLTAVFGGVRVEEDDGYFVFTAEKRGETRADKKR